MTLRMRPIILWTLPRFHQTTLRMNNAKITFLQAPQTRKTIPLLKTLIGFTPTMNAMNKTGVTEGNRLLQTIIDSNGRIAKR